MIIPCKNFGNNVFGSKWIPHWEAHADFVCVRACVRACMRVVMRICLWKKRTGYTQCIDSNNNTLSYNSNSCLPLALSSFVVFLLLLFLPQFHFLAVVSSLSFFLSFFHFDMLQLYRTKMMNGSSWCSDECKCVYDLCVAWLCRAKPSHCIPETENY